MFATTAGSIGEELTLEKLNEILDKLKNIEEPKALVILPTINGYRLLEYPARFFEGVYIKIKGEVTI